MHTQAMAAREKVFNIRFTGEEWERVQRLSGVYGLSAASLFRFLLKAAEAREALPKGLRAETHGYDTPAISTRKDHDDWARDPADADAAEAETKAIDSAAKAKPKAKAPPKAKARATTKGKK